MLFLFSVVFVVLLLWNFWVIMNFFEEFDWLVGGFILVILWKLCFSKVCILFLVFLVSILVMKVLFGFSMLKVKVSVVLISVMMCRWFVFLCFEEVVVMFDIIIFVWLFSYVFIWLLVLLVRKFSWWILVLVMGLIFCRLMFRIWLIFLFDFLFRVLMWFMVIWY